MRAFRSHLLLSILGIGITLGVYTFSLLHSDFMWVDRVASQFPFNGAWHAIAHFSHNAYFPWHFPLLHLISTSGALTDQIHFGYLSAYFFGSCLLLPSLIQRAVATHYCTALFLSCLICSTLLSLFGVDTVILAAFFSFVILASAGLFCAQRRCSVTISVLCGLVVGALAFSLSSIAASLAWFGALAFIWAMRQTSTPQVRQFFAAALVALSLLLITVPQVPFPHYPWNARLVPDDRLPGHIYPSFAPSFPLPTINLEAILPNYFFPTLLLFLVACTVFLMARARRFPALALGLTTLLVMHCTLPVEWSIVLPLASGARLVPYLALFPIEPFLTALSLLFCVLSLPRKFLALGAPLILLIFVYTAGMRPSTLFALPALQNSSVVQRWFSRHLDTMPLADRKKLLSPSLALIQREGTWVLRARLRHSHRFVSLPQTLGTILVSQDFPYAPASAVLDGDPATRWTASKGGQRGDEWLAIEFPSEMAIDGLRLSPGNFSTDFPRGLEFRNVKNCSQGNAQSMLVSPPFYSLVPYPGAIQSTKYGYPYYAPHHVVEVIFPTTIHTRCLMVRQTEQANWDWSVTDVGIAGKGVRGSATSIHSASR